ncbi:MAG: hypothetical protein JSR76_05980 [Verrucomicrobia bacterium]|nr:hypothetical protein [Verrucomicrobiota bacterium]
MAATVATATDTAVVVNAPIKILPLLLPLLLGYIIRLKIITLLPLKTNKINYIFAIIIINNFNFGKIGKNRDRNP